MYPQTDLAIASQIIADRIRHAEFQHAVSAAKRERPRLRFSLRSPFGRRPVAGAVH